MLIDDLSRESNIHYMKGIGPLGSGAITSCMRYTVLVFIHTAELRDHRVSRQIFLLLSPLISLSSLSPLSFDRFETRRGAVDANAGIMVLSMDDKFN